MTVIKDTEIMPRVWVVNFAGHNHSKAETYGELRFITKGYVSLGSMDRVLFEVVESIAQTEPDDFMLPCGLLILNVIASAACLHRHGVMRVLIWDKKGPTYREVEYTGEHLDYLLRHLSAPKVHEETD
jgi:hypothetical protein